MSDPHDRFARAAEAIVPKAMEGRKFFGPARAAFGRERHGPVLAEVGKVDPANHGAQQRAAVATLKRLRERAGPAT